MGIEAVNSRIADIQSRIIAMQTQQATAAKTSSAASTDPASASYFFSAVGLAMPKFGRASAPRNDDDRRVNRMLTVYLPRALHPL